MRYGRLPSSLHVIQLPPNLQPPWWPGSPLDAVRQVLSGIHPDHLAVALSSLTRMYVVLWEFSLILGNLTAVTISQIEDNLNAWQVRTGSYCILAYQNFNNESVAIHDVWYHVQVPSDRPENYPG